MKTTFSKKWQASKQPRKQRKFQANAPFHIRKNFSKSRLSKELVTQHKQRNLVVRRGDKVRVLRGSFKGREGNILRINRQKAVVYIDGLEVKKRNGTVTQSPIHASNLIITSLAGGDKNRMKQAKKIAEKAATKRVVKATEVKPTAEVKPTPNATPAPNVSSTPNVKPTTPSTTSKTPTQGGNKQ